MAAGDLTSLSNVKAWLGLTDPTQTEDDSLLTWLITAASQFIQTWCCRSFASQAYIETRDGTGGNRMPFINTPVTNVASLLVNGINIPPGDAVTTPGFYFTPTMLALNGHGFARGTGNVVITYTAGFAAVPPEIEQACIELVGQRFRDKDRIGLASKGVGGETTAFLVKDMPDSCRTILDTYKRILPL
jgi:hypothetical protein